MLKSFSGNAIPTETTSGILATDAAGATFTVLDATGYPTGTDPFVIVLNRGTASEEKMLVTRSTNTFTISARGHDGTTAVDHASGAPVHHTIDADTIREANTHANGNLTLHSSGTAASGQVPVANGAGAIIWDYLASAGGFVTVAPSDATPTVKSNADYVCDGTDDELEIEDALTAHPAVMLLNGIFNIRTTVNIPANNKVLVGQSHGAVLRTANAANANCLIAAGVQDVICAGFTIDGNGANQTATCMGAQLGGLRVTFDNLWIYNSHYMGIQVSSGARDFLITNCKIVNTYNFHGIGIYGNATSPTYHGSVVHNYVEGTAKAGISIQEYASYIDISHNHTKDTIEDGVMGYNAANLYINFIGNLVENPGNHGSHIGGNHIVWANNTVYNANHSACYAYNHDGTRMRNVVISDNICHLTRSTAGFPFYGWKIDNFTLTGNIADSPATHALYVRDCENFTVEGNTVHTTPHNGLRVMGSRRGTVVGNSIYGANDCIHMTSDGTTLHTIYVTVTGNSLSNAADRPVYEAPNGNYNIIMGNTGSGNRLGYTVSGANTINVNNITVTTL